MQAMEGGLREWEATPEGTVAKIILLDQFTRNVHRGSGKAFAGDQEVGGRAFCGMMLRPPL